MKIIFIITFLSYLSAVDITFSVDMSNEELTSGCSPTVAGSFNNWSSAYNLTDSGYGIWETTIDLNPNSYYEFKFGICGWQLENLPPEGTCTVTNYGYTNRFLSTLNESLSLETYYYASCDISEDGEDNADWVLVWSDEFDAPEIDMNKWSYEVGTGNWGWGNGEAQYYTDNSNNSFIEDGKLIIKAIRQYYAGSDYTSARMVTKNKGDWTYGRFEIRAKLPAGTGTWPAIWMMPTDSEYGGWPDSGEIDIMEHVGFDPGTIHATCHNDTYNWYDGIPPPGGELNVNDFDENFHTYTLEWTESSLKWFVDETLYYTYSNTSSWSTWPYNHDFFIILNIAIGGTWGGQQGIDDSIFPVQMEVEYVRVYQGGGGSEPGSSDVTFLVDMQNEQIDESGIYVSGGDSQLAGPAGIFMSDSDNDNIWSVTIPLEPGTYTYKFRNGYYNYWDGPGWEDANSLEDCGVGEWNDRQITVSDEDFVVGPYCFSSCEPCENENSCDTLGDVNNDDVLNILDIVTIINIILSDEMSDPCSDFNQDGITNILDLVSLVSAILES
ncbi:MAG: family 16 glycosylhydrolase [Candidatus Marinimicrobia bacterium]|nr:family 16 glycosylhydrolase [Candidatus Neomarinimicrobiota bacterium]